MPTFKVLLEQPKGIFGHNDRSLNPFLIRDIFNPHLRSVTAIREFVFDADSEDDVLRLYNEAQKQGIPNVQGFRIRSIEQI